MLEEYDQSMQLHYLSTKLKLYLKSRDTVPLMTFNLKYYAVLSCNDAATVYWKNYENIFD